MIRLGFLLLSAWHKRALTPLDESVLSLRVLPTDIDIYGRMHSSRYLSIMILGRLDLSVRMGLLALMWKQRWITRVVAVNIRYLQPLKLLQRYELSTRLLCWDNQWWYLEQRFQYHHKTVAISQLKIRVEGRTNNIAPGYLLELLGYDPASPTMPATIQYWARVN
ncbi:MAG: acyl-CoA thioesterase [Pseudomonadota bacterium]|nr:acyl-CoA thioesterase [Pseudomonadota bacterium]